MTSEQNMRLPNREIIGRLLYVAECGTSDQRNAANARLAAIRDAYRHDHRFPSSNPVVLALETECWTWWHQITATP